MIRHGDSMNYLYARLTKSTADRILEKAPGTLVAGVFRRTTIKESSLIFMRELARDVRREPIDSCFCCKNVAVQCPEDAVVSCRCGREYYKYHDITDYENFVEIEEPSKWKSFWNRLRFKT